MGRQRALEIMMTGRNVQADEAAAIGLVLEVTEEDVREAAMVLATRIARNGRSARLRRRRPSRRSRPHVGYRSLREIAQ